MIYLFIEFDCAVCAAFQCALMIFQVTWTKDGRDITHNEHYMCQYSSGVCTMEVQSAMVSDSGTYTCIAVNELGTEETSSYVVVEGMTLP